MVVQPHTPGKAHVAPPTTKVVGLSELPPSKAARMDWLAKGHWLLEQNSGLLNAALNRPVESLTLVTAMVDLGRDKLGGGFKRTFSEYIDRMKAFVKYDLPKVLFLDANHLAEFQPLLDTSPSPVHVIPITTDDIKKNFAYFDELQKIRTDKKWSNRQDWLSHSPQATLEFYNPLVMSKVRLTTEAARLNPHNTDGFIFIDAGHLCNDPSSFSTKNTPFIAENLINKGMLTTFFEYTPSEWHGEIHGFEAAAFQRYIGDDKLPLRVGRGGVFGGRPEFLAVAAELFELVKAETLLKGFMGTEGKQAPYRFVQTKCAHHSLSLTENFFAIIDYRFPGVIQRYDNGDGGNCGVFNYIRSPPRDPEKYGYRLRHLKCSGDWKQLSAVGKPSCWNAQGAKCPAAVTPKYLDDAPNQWTCHETDKYFCTVQCNSDSDMAQVGWSAHPCGSGDKPCLQPDQGGVKLGQQAELAAEEEIKASYDAAGPKDGIDLRGLVCGRKADGSTVCHSDDPTDREYCPPQVTPEYLTAAKGNRMCQPSDETHFCTVTCNPLVKEPMWHVHDIAWCKKNQGSCPPRPSRTPLSQWALPAYTPPAIPPRACQARAAARLASGGGGGGAGALRGGEVSAPGVIAELTVGILVYGSKELATVQRTLETFQDNGLLSGVSQVLVYLNKRDAKLDSFFAPWVARTPNMRLMGDAQNYGILHAFNWLVGNATTPYFMFMEKDFRMIEPWECGFEELSAGVKLVKEGTAHVVKYRHRWRAGSPNWAKVLFKGKENKVFRQQPNLFCNHYHWMPHPEERWPDKIWYCNKDPYMYCIDSRECNWTNNPVLLSTKWWAKEYVANFGTFKYHDPYKDIEFYMNWEPNAWNERHWIVAQGDGLFRHEDYAKWG